MVDEARKASRTASASLSLFLGLALLIGAASAQVLPGPYLSWSFEESSTAHLKPSVPTGAVFASEVRGPAAWAEGKRGKALSFDGSNTFVAVALSGTDAALLGGRNFSLMAWVNADSVGGRRPLIAKRTTGGPSPFILAIRNKRLVFEACDAQGKWSYICDSGSVEIKSGVWTHVGATVEEASRRVTLFIDGVAVKSHEGAAELALNREGLQFGKDAWGGEPESTKAPGFFKGRMDEVRIFARTLSVAEMAAEAAGRASLSPDNTAPPPVAAKPVPWIQLRGGFPRFLKSLAEGKQVRLVTLGGASAQGAGLSSASTAYPTSFAKTLRARFPKANLVEYNVSLAGAGSWLGACRAPDEVIAHYIPLGLVVVDFSAEDSAEPEERALSGMEGIVRQIRAKHPEAEILFAYSLPKDGFARLKSEGELPSIRWHERVAAHYGIASVGLARHAYERVNAGALAAADFFDGAFQVTEKGQALYREAAARFIEVAVDSNDPSAPIAARAMPAPLAARPMEKARLEPYAKSVYETGWLDWQESPVDRFFHVVRCEESGPTIAFRFQGDRVGLYGVLGPDSGDLEFSLDGAAWQRVAMYEASAARGYRPQAVLLAENLDPASTHLVKVRVAPQIPAGSKGRLGRLAFFLVNGSAVFDDPYKNLTPLQRIDTIYAGMPAVKYVPESDRWKQIPRTISRLANGEGLRIVMLGDSIVNDTSSSDYELLLMRRYPKCQITKIKSVRGSTGCWWYKDENRVKEYVLDHKPDLLMIGGISQRDDVDSIREVIRQVRAAQPVEVLLMSGAFGFTDPRTDPAWTFAVDPTGTNYRSRLKRMAGEEKCEFLDMTGPWGQYIRENDALGAFKRDRVHANDRGKQILGRILDLYFAPKGK
jgi:hypothetical protein